MAAKSSLHLLILCGILCQGIIGTLAGENIGESSDLLVREKRVINLGQNGRLATLIQAVPYIVDIRENNRSTCVGAILSHYTVITAASCVSLPLTAYKVNSGSSYVKTSETHLVTSKSIHLGNRPRQVHDGIALITVDPLFNFTQRRGFINLYAGRLLPGTNASVTGWGCHSPRVPTSNMPRRLRTIRLPIMNHEECLHIYPSRVGLSSKHICTYDEERLCAHTDIGAPLVVDNMLAGIHVYKGEFLYQKNPDVFIDVQHPDYNSWIRENTILI